MTTKSNLKLLLVLSILVMLMLVSGCISCGASGSSDKIPVTPTPQPTATATPAVIPGSNATSGSTSTTQNVTQPSATVTPTVTPTPTPTARPLYNASNPYAAPGWPTYGVDYYLNMSDIQSTGSIFGYVYSPVPSGSPVPADSNYYRVHVESATGLMTPRDLTLDSSGRYETSGLSYGTYYVSWYFMSPTVEDVTETVFLDANHQRVQQNFYVYT